MDRGKRSVPVVPNLPENQLTKFCALNLCCFTRHGILKGFKQSRWSSGSFKGIGNGAVR